uniref:Uncharacterized protein n=1 Tax=Lactuca sativa TaxID=4236 RepID=A0A9R1XS44_LACSA|nr:hypothetical protein LSAT_V11C300136870 [Lactuca sativa]
MTIFKWKMRRLKFKTQPMIKFHKKIRKKLNNSTQDRNFGKKLKSIRTKRVFKGENLDKLSGGTKQLDFQHGMGFRYYNSFTQPLFKVPSISTSTTDVY